VRREGVGLEGEPRENARVRTQSRVTLPSNLAWVNEAAWRDKSTRFTALLHHVDVRALERAFRRLKRSAAPGVDGETVASYEQGLAQNLERLHAQIHSGRYRPQPVRGCISPRLTVAKGRSESPRSKIRLFRVR
jgi:retron-type reverse transcriptase